MAQGYFWKGYLKLSLVTCGVGMLTITSDREKVRFHVLNRATGNRIASRYVDTGTGKPVADRQLVKGYPQGEDNYVLLEDEELEAVELETARTIDVDMFVPRDSIDWIWLDTPHFLVPIDKVSEEAFAVIREAMKSSDRVGIARLVLYRRERAVMLVPRGRGIVVWTLRYGDEVRDAADYADAVHGSPADPAARRMIETLIRERMGEWSEDLVTDPVQARLQDLVKAKRKGIKAQRPKKPAPSEGNVIDLMDALRRSLKSKA